MNKPTSSSSSPDPSTYSTDDDSSAPSSDPDRASYAIDLDLFPRPFGIGPQTPNSKNSFLVHSINRQLQTVHDSMGREPTQEEAEAIVYWSTKTRRTASFGSPIGGAISTIRAYQTIDTYRFPFYKPEKAAIDAFIAKNSGQASVIRLLLHSGRFAAYWVMGTVVGTALAGSYAAAVGAVGQVGDKRLKDYVAAIARDRGAKRGGLVGRNAGQKQQPDQAYGDREEEAATEQWRGMDSQGGSDTNSPSRIDSISWPSDADSHTSPIQRQPSKQSSASSSHGTGYSKLSREEDLQSKSGLDLYDVDDASPTAPYPPSSSSSSGQRSGSTWERIRQQSQSQGRQAGNPTQKSERPFPRQPQAFPEQRAQEGSDSGMDGFLDSGAERKDQASREAAQREFDERVERERRGGDFGGGGDQKRW